MTTLLKKYKYALKYNKREIASRIEEIILKYAETFEFERKDKIIEALTLASI